MDDVERSLTLSRVRGEEKGSVREERRGDEGAPEEGKGKKTKMGKTTWPFLSHQIRYQLRSESSLFLIDSG